MKKILAGILLIFATSCAYGDEWVPYVYRPPVQQIQVVQNFQMVPYYVPVVVSYVPVTVYQNVLVEHKIWCLHKRYEIVNIPQTVYVPVKY
jgi:hypothetical protein